MTFGTNSSDKAAEKQRLRDEIARQEAEVRRLEQVSVHDYGMAGLQYCELGQSLLGRVA